MDSRIGHDADFLAWTQQQARLLREAAHERINTPIDFAHILDAGWWPVNRHGLA